MFGISTRVIRAAGTVLAAAALVTTATSSAQAVTQVGSSGYPGSVSLGRIVGTYDGTWTGHLDFPARTVTESTRYASSWQYVCVNAELVYAMGAKYWLTDATYRTCSWISPAATTATVAGQRFGNLLGLGSTIYSGNVTVTWQLQNGTLIGSRTLDYAAQSDYACATGNCWTGMTTWGGGGYIAFN